MQRHRLPVLNCLRPFAQRGLALNRSVEVWLADPDALADECLAQRCCLSSAERQRLEGLHFQRDRMLYLASHVFLRQLLCLYQPNEPAEWHFEAGPHGRPLIVQPLEAPGLRLHFSLSHTHGLIAVAVARGWEVGVDVERARDDTDLDLVCEALLAGPEKLWFPRIAPASRASAFASLWTLKEALLKACGAGIGEDLGKLALLHSLDDPCVVITRSRHLATYPEWSVVFGTAPGGHALALAAHGRLTTAAEAPPAGRRRVAVFDLRQADVDPRGAKLCNAVLLPVKAASTAPARTLVPA
jgi:4'-phosphopantetheinyl transferase